MSVLRIVLLVVVVVECMGAFELAYRVSVLLVVVLVVLYWDVLAWVESNCAIISIVVGVGLF